MHKYIVIDLTYVPNPIERHQLTDEARQEECKQAAWSRLLEHLTEQPDELITVFVDDEPLCGYVPTWVEL